MLLHQIADNQNKQIAVQASAHSRAKNVPYLAVLKANKMQLGHAQELDFACKIVVDFLAFCQLQQLPNSSIIALADHLSQYNMHWFTLICLDGLLLLGASFIEKVSIVLAPCN